MDPGVRDPIAPSYGPVKSRGMDRGTYGATETHGISRFKAQLKPTTPVSKVKEAALGGAEALAEVGMCCGLDPPGGWYGPFGMLRFISISFLLLAAFGGFACLWAESWQEYLSAVLLIVGALASAVSGFTHEGLMRQVEEYRNLNIKYHDTLEHLKAEIKGLGNIGERLDELKKTTKMNEETLQDVIHNLDFFGDMTVVNTILKAYANNHFSQGERNHFLQGPKLESFMTDVRGILQKDLPLLNIQELMRASAEHGLNLMQVMLISNALVVGDDLPANGPARADAYIKLLLFSLEPGREQRMQAVLKTLGPVLRYSGEYGGKGLEQELVYLKQLAGDMGVVPEDKIQKLVNTALFPPRQGMLSAHLHHPGPPLPKRTAAGRRSSRPVSHWSQRAVAADRRPMEP